MNIYGSGGVDEQGLQAASFHKFEKAWHHVQHVLSCFPQAGHESTSTLRITTASMRRMAPSSTQIYK
jgi:hypothetical protein